MTGRKARSEGAIEKEIAVALLAGEDARYATVLFENGLNTFGKLREANYEVLVATCERRSTRSHYVATALPYGAQLRLWFYGRRVFDVRNRLGKSAFKQYAGADVIARDLAMRCKNDPRHVARVAATLERARRRCLELVEESTRWL